MISFLTTLLKVLDKVLGIWSETRWKQQGRQETIKEMNDALNREIEMAQDAVSISDPERDERLRNKFDRSRTGK